MDQSQTIFGEQAYVRQLPDARLVVIPDSHHALPVELPEEFNAAVAEFLAARGASGQPRA